MKSCLNLPQRATAGVGVTCILAGYSKLRSAYKRCASLLDSHSMNFWASAGLSECFTTPAPETLTNYCWTWIAIDRNSKQILGFVCGKRDTNTFKRLYQQLNTHNIQLFCSDYWKSYREVIPKPKHITSKAQTFTIEGYNSLIRHFIARFRRKSKCYSKSEKMIENTLNLLFAKWNGSLRYVF